MQFSSENTAFADWLAQLSYNSELIGCIELPSYIRRTQDFTELCEHVFLAAELTDSHCSADFFSKHVILAVLNINTYLFNEMLMN